MDKSQKKELKKKYLEEHRRHDFAFQIWSIREEQIRQVSRIDEATIKQWTDEQLELKIVNYVLNQFSQAGKRPKHQHVQEWERSILLKLPLAIQAIFATYLFESDLCLNGSCFDFFLQNNGAFALETLKGYQLMQNEEMIDIVQQCIGAYLKMKRAGEVEALMGEPHHWIIYISINQKNFEQLDAICHLHENDFFKRLKEKKIKFIRNNIELLKTEG